MKDNGHEGTRAILGNSRVKTISADFEQKLLQKIMTIERRKAYRRIALIFLLRFFVIALLCFLLVWTYLPQISAGSITISLSKMIEDSDHAAVWILQHIYFIIPFTVLMLFRKVFVKGITVD